MSLGSGLALYLALPLKALALVIVRGGEREGGEPGHGGAGMIRLQIISAVLAAALCVAGAGDGRRGQAPAEQVLGAGWLADAGGALRLLVRASLLTRRRGDGARRVRLCSMR